MISTSLKRTIRYRGRYRDIKDDCIRLDKGLKLLYQRITRFPILSEN